MTLSERIASLDRRHHRFVLVQDPWHMAVLARHQWFADAFNEGRVQPGDGQSSLHIGPIYDVWFSVDEKGKLLQEWGFDAPPVFQ